MRCLSCHYNLAHLTQHRCPECGLAFDPSDPHTYQTEHRWRRIRWVLNWWLFWFLLPLIVVFGFVIFIMLGSVLMRGRLD